MPSKSLPNTEGRTLNLNSSNPSSSNLDVELFGILRDREERVTFLERELVETRLQLAIAKTSEDNLLHEAKKLRFHLKKGGRSEVQEDQDNDASATDFQRTLSLPHNMIQIRPSLSERRTPEDRANGVCMPMGQPIRSRDPTSSSGDLSESTDLPPPRLNLNSCASGLDLLAGNMNAVSHHRMLGDLGRSTAPNVSSSDRNGDAAAGQRQMPNVVPPGQQQRNEEWDLPRSASTTRHRPQGNMFLNHLLSTRPQPVNRSYSERGGNVSSRSSSTSANQHTYHM